jgi:hypothetical protein
MRANVRHSSGRTIVAFIAALLANLLMGTAYAGQCPLPIPLDKNGDGMRLTTAAPPAGDAYIFLDASPGMRGFVRQQSKATDDVMSFRDIIYGLPHALNQVAPKTYYQKVRGGMTPIKTSRVLEAAEPTFYKCKPGTPINKCNKYVNNHQDIISFSTQIPTSSLLIYVSDLFIGSVQILEKGEGSLRHSLKEIIASNRAVALMGLKVGFKGTIFGLPSGRRYGDAKSRPVYLLAIGPKDSVLNFISATRKELGDSWKDGDHNILLFAPKTVNRPIIGRRWPKDAFTPNRPASVSRIFNEAVPVQQFLMPKSGASLTASAALDSVLAPYVMPPKTLRVEETIWRYREDEDDCVRHWQKIKIKPGLVEVESKKGVLNFLFEVKKSGGVRLASRRAYLVSAEVVSTDIGVDETLTKWVSDWSFDERTEDSLYLNSVAFFPTLNLRRLVSLFESASKAAFTPELIARFNLGIFLER